MSPTPPTSLRAAVASQVRLIAASWGPQPGMQLVTRMEDALAFGAQIAGPILLGPARSGVEQVMRQRVEIVPVGPETVSGVRGNLYRIVLVAVGSRLQDAIDGPARATVSSVAALLSELAAIAIYGLWALDGLAPIALGILLMAVVMPRWLRPFRRS